MSDLYKDLVFRFIDRMGDVAECDPAEKILEEFVVAFNQVWRNDPDNVVLKTTFKYDESEFVTLKNDDGGVEGLSESEKVEVLKIMDEIVDNGDRYCSECGQEWTGTL